jgi:hypothetical protein
MRPLIATDIANIANIASPVRKQLIAIAAFDLHRAALNHTPFGSGSGPHRSSLANGVLPWYIPPFAVLEILR